MFNYSFHLPEAASLIESAIEKTLAAGFRTPDIFSDGCKLVNTDQMTQQVIANM
jgi:3-isopropylmalate dehydrogenase